MGLRPRHLNTPSSCPRQSKSQQQALAAAVPASASLPGHFYLLEKRLLLYGWHASWPVLRDKLQRSQTVLAAAIDLGVAWPTSSVRDGVLAPGAHHPVSAQGSVAGVPPALRWAAASRLGCR
eukprot:scaffold44_cov411-Prasinococcus_capsulatus_cf.AAC.21